MPPRATPRRRNRATPILYLAVILLAGLFQACSDEGGTTRPRIDAPASGKLNGGAAGTAYESTIAVAGSGPFAWEIVAGALPPGLTLGAATGVISGTPTAAGPYTFTVRATNALGSDEVELTITIAAIAVAPVITTTSLLDGAATIPYGAQLAATGTAPITWSVSLGVMPDGVALGTTTGALAGTPTAAGETTFTVTATNAAGTDAQELTLRVAEAPTAPTIQAPGPIQAGVAILPAGTVQSAYSQTFQATGTAPITWSISSGQLPTGITLGESTGTLAGTPGASGEATFAVRATNAIGSTTQECSLTVDDVLTLSGISPSTAPVGSRITLTGTGFDTATWSNNEVRFNGDLATILDVTATTIHVEVPQAQPSASLPVTVSIGAVTSESRPFTVADFAVIFVDADASDGANDGSSWTDAYRNLRTALSDPDAGEKDFWVAAGTYLPGSERGDTFNITSFKLFGGFAGTEGSLADRDWVQNPTILTGDVNADDQPDWQHRGDNLHHVVTTEDQATLDGFIVTGGNADGAGGSAEDGGLVYALPSGTAVTLRSCTFLEGMAASDGGGVYVRGGSAQVVDCRFLRCSGRWGGGITTVNSNPPSMTLRCSFYRCESSDGPGGIYTNGGENITRDCVFVGCRGKYGGALCLNSGGAVDNCTFVGNTTTYVGGGMFADPGSQGVSVSRCLFWGNLLDGQSASGVSIGLNQATTSDTSIDNCLLEGGIAGIAAQNGSTFASAHCTDLAPTFVDDEIPLGPDGILGTSDDGLVLQSASEGVDAGGTGVSTTDIRGVGRPQGDHHDVGAYETPAQPGN